MATTPPTNSGQPLHTHVIFRVSKRKPIRDGEEISGMTFIQSYEDVSTAGADARQMAETDPTCNYVVFEAVQVFAQVSKVEMIYSRRG